MNTDAKRTPDTISNLKTHPGGHRRLKRFDPRIKALWTLLVSHAGDDHTLTVNVTEYAATLNVSRRTVQRWLGFLERRHLIKRKQRRGGRGRGIAITVTWLQRGEALTSRRKHAEEQSLTDHVKPQQVSVSGKTVTEGHKTVFNKLAFDGQPHDDAPIRTPGYGRWVMFNLRKAINGTKLNQQQKETVLSQLAKWMWAKTVTVAQLRRIHEWLIKQRGKSVGFTGRALVGWLARQLHGVVQWAHQRQQDRQRAAEDRLWVAKEAEFERNEAACRAAMTPARAEAIRAEVRAALVADGWALSP